MSNFTDKLDLFKYDVEQDKKSTFNINQCLNNNWDIIDDFAENISNFVDSKANLELNNITQSAKENIANFSAPDFSRCVQKSPSTIYQADCDGYIYFAGNSISTQYIVARFSLDGTFKDLPFINENNCVYAFGNQSGITLRGTFFIPCPKGMYYKVELPSSDITQVWFIKAKGVQ